MLIIALGTNIASICLVSAILEIVLTDEVPPWIIVGNIIVFVCCVYIVYRAVTVWPDGEPREIIGESPKQQ